MFVFPHISHALALIKWLWDILLLLLATIVMSVFVSAISALCVLLAPGVATEEGWRREGSGEEEEAEREERVCVSSFGWAPQLTFEQNE